MKLIFAIVNKDDSSALIDELNNQQISVTKISSCGGFLSAGNVTLMIGVEQENVETALDIIRDKCKSRTEITNATSMCYGTTPWPVEVPVGGATIFVVDVDRFEKI